MTDVQAVEQGVLRAVGKIALIVALIGILGFTVYQFYIHSESYQDRKGQEQLTRDLGGTPR